MTHPFTELELEAFLDEALTSQEMARVEACARQDPELARQLAAINARRDAGVHTLGEIWRRHRISCPTREQLGSFLLDALSAEQADYVRFHLDKVGCRFCQANLDDMRQRQKESSAAAAHRHTRYFQSSVGYLRPK
jgi:hypothetical protein